MFSLDDSVVDVVFSTVSSGINALAANTVEDILARPLRTVKDTTVTVIAKLLGTLSPLACLLAGLHVCWLACLLARLFADLLAFHTMLVSSSFSFSQFVIWSAQRCYYISASMSGTTCTW